MTKKYIVKNVGPSLDGVLVTIDESEDPIVINDGLVLRRISRFEDNSYLFSGDSLPFVDGLYIDELCLSLYENEEIEFGTDNIYGAFIGTRKEVLSSGEGIVMTMYENAFLVNIHLGNRILYARSFLGESANDAKSYVSHALSCLDIPDAETMITKLWEMEDNG